MRFLEILFSVAAVLAFFVLVIPRASRWIPQVLPFAVLLAIGQVLVEGARWQMYPMYAITSLFCLFLLKKKYAPERRPVENTMTHRILVGTKVSLGLIALAACIALPIILPVFQFPQPTGPYAIGTVTYDWTDNTRREIFSTDPTAHRELMVQIWYPAQKVSSPVIAEYIDDACTAISATARIRNLSNFFLQHIKYVITHAEVSGPVASDKPQYPVLVYLEGLTGFRQMTTFQVEELVSHGYIVVALDQPGASAAVTFSDGHQIAIGVGAVPPMSQMLLLVNQSFSPNSTTPVLNGKAMPNGIIPYFADDVSFVLDQLGSLEAADPQKILTGKLDLKRTGVFGMSLGGAVGTEACLKDPRIKACLIEDVAMPADVVSKGLQQPAMFITRPASTMKLERQTSGGWSDADIAQTLSSMHEVYSNLSIAGYHIQIPGMYHIDMTDLNLLSPLMPYIGLSGPIGASRAHNIVNAYSLRFFDKELKGDQGVLLEQKIEDFPEVMFETRRP